VAGHDLRAIVSHLESAGGAADHAVDVSFRAGVDEGIRAVEEKVAHVQDVGLGEVHHDVGVCMCRRHVGQDDLLAVDVDRAAIGEGLADALNVGSY